VSRILIIDDDAYIRELFQALLEKNGYETQTAQDGQVGTTLFYKKPFDLVICDLVMPEKEGIETIRGFRRDFPDLKIIAISGGGREKPDGYLQMAGMLGANRVFKKPIDIDELLECVRELLGIVD